MEIYEIDDYLGDAADQLDTDQKRELAAIGDDLATRYDEDDPGRGAAFAAAVAYMLGDTNTHDAAHTYRAAQQTRDETLAAAIQVASMSGLSEVAAAAAIGISRNTVRSHLGKNSSTTRKARAMADEVDIIEVADDNTDYDPEAVGKFAFQNGGQCESLHDTLDDAGRAAAKHLGAGKVELNEDANYFSGRRWTISQ